MAHCHDHQELDEPVAECRRRVLDAVTVLRKEHSNKLFLSDERVSFEEINNAVDVSPLFRQNGVQNADGSHVWKLLDGNVCL